MFRLRLLGTTDLMTENGSSVQSVLAQPKRVALLAFLTAAQPRGLHPRSRLLPLFWPESSEEHARNSLRQAIHYLRRSLGPETIVAQGEHIGVSSALVSCDVVEFREAWEHRNWREALLLYQADFLLSADLPDAPEFMQWVDEERSRLRGMAAMAARTLSLEASATGEIDAAVEWTRRWSDLSPADEAPIRLQIELLDHAGEPAAAMSAYEEFSTALRLRYELEPSADLRDRVLALRAAAIRSPSASSPDVDRQPENATSRHLPSVQLASHPQLPGPIDEKRPPLGRPPAVDDFGVSSGVDAEATAARPAAVRRTAPILRPLTLGWRMMVAGTAVMFMALVAAGLYSTVEPRQNEVTDVRLVTSVAVLPFTAEGAEADDLLGRGIADEILTTLSSIPGLRVPARTSSFQFAETNVGYPEVRRRLGVQAVLQGTIQRVGSRIRIHTQLVDTRSGYQLWARTYDQPVSEALAVQEEIARSIVHALKVELGHDEDARFAQRGGVPAAAQEAYLRGRSVMIGTGARRDLIEDAIRYFAEATSRAAGWAEAHAAMASALLATEILEARPVASARSSARASAERALQLDPNNAEARYVMAVVHRREGDLEASEQEFRAAIQLNGSYARAHSGYAELLLLELGRVDEAVQHALHAYQLDPQSVATSRTLNKALGFAGRHAEALRQGLVTAEMAPTNPFVRADLAYAYLGIGDHDSAVREMERAVELDRPARRLTLWHYGYVLAFVGRTEEGRNYLMEHTDPTDLLSAARAYAVLGDLDRAFSVLDRVYQENPALLQGLQTDFWFEPIRSEPRFVSLLSRTSDPQAR